ncbi:helix-turn-helix domain-containing protein [Pendulispora brunnea]|uniref:Helix-turn-helix domain-containing protein n=1 Tax=Pendulispora brunnea TaxID=2905690 RepID=A0ABZ2KJW3_9BACT
MIHVGVEALDQGGRAAHPDLRAAVRRCGLHVEFHSPSMERHLILPDAYIELQFYSGACWFEGPDGQARPLPPVFVMGTRSAPGCLVARGLTRVAGVSMHRWRASRLLRLENLHGICTDVGPELQQLGRRVVRLLEEGGGHEALEHIEAWLLARMPKEDDTQEAVDAAGLELHVSRGAARIAPLAAELGLSVRQLERRFKDVAGLSPKALARLIRFSDAQERIELDPNMSLAALACELGYADQAHFNRDFRSFSGITPGQFAGVMQKARRAEATPG